ncbi:hypothetical protein COEREDRAFT_79565 [Coemansia reversa NRRL 1564]|uniref:Secreted protein n=1 Tax=Coemansia reversa (strain ATCC 12441 / NRRL 1564) TaxID=763665 RepID=A0A2G5BJ63_COERN|nr:hypothetical protein COEREDRAFT_79565 [Coemansia reversa NRRL 1564]|eukprot:PIA19060.1 hypothetical protein COEREDRAFT_79565 [Coemansia reversa NRRL 1564]
MMSAFWVAWSSFCSAWWISATDQQKSQHYHAENAQEFPSPYKGRTGYAGNLKQQQYHNFNTSDWDMDRKKKESCATAQAQNTSHSYSREDRGRLSFL